jgi:hypothetical protein
MNIGYINNELTICIVTEKELNNKNYNIGSVPDLINLYNITNDFFLINDLTNLIKMINKKDITKRDFIKLEDGFISIIKRTEKNDLLINTLKNNINGLKEPLFYRLYMLKEIQLNFIKKDNPIISLKLLNDFVLIITLKDNTKIMVAPFIN